MSGRHDADSLLACLPSLASADEAARPTKLTADFGYVKTGGNSDVTTVSGADNADEVNAVLRAPFDGVVR